jgi:tetratricopeptide (TPR) repeat protein
VSSHETSDVADAAKRVRAWAEHLEELGRAEEAQRVLREALERDGNEVSIALMLAGLQARAGAPERAVELLRKILGDHPGNLAATRMLARLLLDSGETSEAFRVVADAAARIGKVSTTYLAELTGEIYRAQGRHAEAVSAFGPRASLSPRGRRLRRGSWWRSGGPLRRRPGGRAAPPDVARGGAAVLPLGAPDAMLEVIAWARWLSVEGRHDDARRVIREALTTHGRHARLLASAAEIEDAADAKNTSLLFWRAAYQEAPDDIDVSCGLAECLANTWVTPSYTYRIGEALRVLDDFPDQDHPRIRATRAEILHLGDASTARVVAAYGRAGGLSRSAARARRRLWWRSAGPVGQLGIRIADRIRGAHHIRPIVDLAFRTEAETEAVARVLDSVRELPPLAAKQRIEEAFEEHGRLPSLLLAHAEADEQDKAFWHSLAMVAEAARSSPSSLDTVCRLASALNSMFDYGTALQVLKSLPPAARQTVEARVTTGDLHRYAGNFALAAAAYGDPRDLERFDRKSRRRCVRRSLLRRWRPRPAGRIDLTPIDLASFDPVAPAIAHVLDRVTQHNEPPAKLREICHAAIHEHGRHPRLLLALADVELGYGDRHTGAAMAAEAMRDAPEDPLIVAACIRDLRFAGYHADALRTIRDLSEQLKRSPAICETAGAAYQDWRLWGHAADAFGRGMLRAYWRRRRRSCWWRSGGPISWIRSWIISYENTLLSKLELPEWQAAALTALPLPASLREAIRGDQATYHMALTHRRQFLPTVLEAWLMWIGGLASTVIAFATFTLVERLHWPSATMTHGLVVAALITAADVATAWVVDRHIRRWGTRIALAAAAGIGAAVLVRLPGQLAFGAGLALAAAACVTVVAYSLRQALRIGLRIRMVRWQRWHAESDVLSVLLALLGQLMAPQQRRDTSARRSWMADLERAAVTIERVLPFALRSGDPDSHKAIVARANGAATALRRMKQLVALPQEAQWQDLINQLTGLVTALGRDDFTSWPPPVAVVAAPRPPRTLRVRLMINARTVLVIFLPPLVAYLLPLALPLTGPGLSWLRFASIVWALLGTMIILDPAWADRVVKMREGLDLLRRASKGTDMEEGGDSAKGEDQSPASPGPVGTAIQQSQNGPRRMPGHASRPRAPRPHR